MGPKAGLDGRKISSSPGFDPGPSSPVAQSLYRLSYRAHFHIKVLHFVNEGHSQWTATEFGACLVNTKGWLLSRLD